jgi:transcriptional regulator with XRE-family HTH domain
MGPIPELIARFLELHRGKNASELSRATGIDASYISRWRRGKIPTTLQESTRRKLVSAAGSVEPELPGRVSESPPAYNVSGAREYYRGKQDTLMDMMRWVVDQQAEIGRYLKSASVPTSPTVDEVEEGAAILESIDAQQAQKPARHRKRA